MIIISFNDHVDLALAHGAFKLAHKPYFSHKVSTLAGFPGTNQEINIPTTPVIVHAGAE
jgi:hypothetical protein